MCIFKGLKKQIALNFSIDFQELGTRLLVFTELAAVCHGWLGRRAAELSLPATCLINESSLGKFLLLKCHCFYFGLESGPAAGEGEQTAFFRDARAPCAKLQPVFRSLLSQPSHLHLHALRGAPGVFSLHWRQLCLGTLQITEPEAVGHQLCEISAHVLPAPPVGKATMKASHSRWEFPGWEWREHWVSKLSLGAFPSSLELLGWEDANLSPCKEILLKKDF